MKQEYLVFIVFVALMIGGILIGSCNIDVFAGILLIALAVVLLGAWYYKLRKRVNDDQ